MPASTPALPAGVLNFVTGSGSVVGDALAGDPVVQGLTFTGSHDTGTRIYARATQHFARVQLEMGGKNPTIVLDDADLGRWPSSWPSWAASRSPARAAPPPAA